MIYQVSQNSLTVVYDPSLRSAEARRTLTLSGPKMRDAM